MSRWIFVLGLPLTFSQNQKSGRSHPGTQPLGLELQLPKICKRETLPLKAGVGEQCGRGHLAGPHTTASKEKELDQDDRRTEKQVGRIGSRKAKGK